MVKPTDQETTAIEKTICHTQSPRGGDTPCRATWGNTKAGPEAEGTRGKRGPKPLPEFPWEGMSKAG